MPVAGGMGWEDSAEESGVERTDRVAGTVRLRLFAAGGGRLLW